MTMTEFTLRKGESLHIGQNVKVSVQEIRQLSGAVRLEFHCPRDVRIDRKERLEKEPK